MPPRAPTKPTAAAAASRRRPPSTATRVLTHPLAKPLVFVLALAPLAFLYWAAAGDHLGANPQEALERRLGDWTLRFLCLTLAVTPVRQLTGWHSLARFRRMLGLFSAAYMSLHFLAYAWFDKGFSWPDIAHDIGKRPFILVGTAAGLAMLPLAATSFNRAIKALGAARWQKLHRTVYAIAVLAILHFFWMKAGKHDFAEVAVYGTIVAALLGYRVWDKFRPRQRIKTWKQPRGADLISRKS